MRYDLNMKEYQIQTFGLNDLEEQLNRFFEHYPNRDLITITSSGCITNTYFVKGKAKMPIVVSLHYIEPKGASVVD